MNRFALATMMKTKTETPSTPLPNPAADGVGHINVHYKCSRNKLGRILSTYYVARFEHPYFGPFKCIEGFMLYVKTGCCDDSFRSLTGAQAKTHYRKQLEAGKLVERDIPNEERVMMSAILAKLNHNPVIATLFLASEAPFDEYFLFGPGNVPIRPPEGAILTNSLTELRTLMQKGETPELPSNEEYAKLIAR